jgi:prepilin-type N-terminal cleavage/methylation domain-containing protein
MARQRGFTVIELMVVMGIITALVVIGGPYMRDTIRDMRLKNATRNLAGAIHLARSQAMRTQTNHVVMFGTTPSGNPLPAPAVVLADADSDGEIDPGEDVSFYPEDPGTEFQGIPRTTRYGKTLAVGSPADDPDPLGVFAGGTGSGGISSFRSPGGANVNQLLFGPDGIPRTYDPGPPFQAGNLGSGAGAIYLTNGNPATQEAGRDYAIVVKALGGVRVTQWDPAAGAWR